MSFWNLFRTKQNFIVAIIDIGSAQVSGALISISTDRYGKKKNHIIFSTRTETGIDGDLDFERFDFEITKAVKIVTHNLIRNNFRQPEKFICFLASPFLISQTKVINFSQDEQLVFTEKILDNITRREAEDFRQKNESGGQFDIIENKIMQIKLDGYEIENPFGHKTRQLKIAQFLSGSPVRQLNKIRHAINSQSHNNNISFHSYSFAAFSALRDSVGSKKNFLAVDVGGELTDISLCMDGILLENMSFPYGINSIIRDIAKVQKTFRAEARSQLNLYSEGRLQSRAKEIFERSIELSKAKWVQSFIESLSMIVDISVVPEQIILTGDTNANHIFMNWLKEGDFKKYMLSNNPFKISYVDHSKLADLANEKKTVRDTYLIFESMFLEKINK